LNYDYSQWHSGCGEKIISVAGDGLHVTCPKCQISANMEAISGKISATDTFKLVPGERKLIGKLGAEVPWEGLK
jgi:hypothetical protein